VAFHRAVPAPWDCFLLLRSTKTLHVRMERHCANARRIVDYLAIHPPVERVIYPGRADHPQHAVACRQMRDFGGMVTIILKGGLAESRIFWNP
jgi:cystathionine beta-lyase/cystathionine gamma-synthase